MTRVWRWNHPVTVREVLEDLRTERRIAYTTVMTVMDNLHQKGWLRRRQEGRAYRYEPVATRAAYSAALMNEAWSASDNRAAALVEFFSRMTPEQIDALRAALRVVQVPGVRLEASGEASGDATGDPAEAQREAPAEAAGEAPGEALREAPGEESDSAGR